MKIQNLCPSVLHEGINEFGPRGWQIVELGVKSPVKFRSKYFDKRMYRVDH